MSFEPISVLIADDHPMILAGLSQMINESSRLRLVGKANDGRKAVEQFRELKPNVLLIDLHMPEMTGIEAVQAIRETMPEAKTIIVTSFGVEEDVFQALQAGAKGFLMKDASAQTLVDCIITVASGRKYLAPEVAAALANRFDSDSFTRREMHVLTLLAKGMSNKLISRDVGVSEGTIKFHINNIFGKLGVTSRTAALNVALKRGFVRL